METGQLILYDYFHGIHLFGVQITVLLKDTRSYKCLYTGWRWNLYLAHFFSLPPSFSLPHVHVCAPVSVSGYERARNLECQEPYIHLCDTRSLTGPDSWIRLGCLASKSQRSACLCLPSALYLRAGNQTQIPTPVQWALSQLNHLPRLLRVIFFRIGCLSVNT